MPKGSIVKAVDATTTLKNAVRISEWGRDPVRAMIAVSGNDMKTAYVTVGDKDIRLSAIPAHRRAQIIAALQANGEPVTEVAIAHFWVNGGMQR